MNEHRRYFKVEPGKEEIEMILQHYSAEVCSYIEASVSLFFGLVGTLIVLAEVETLLAKVIFSFVYFALGALGIYFYARLFYYRKLLEEVLLEEPYKNFHTKYEKRAFTNSRIIRLTQRISRHENGKYRLKWAWFMLAFSVLVAILSWAVIYFSL